MARQSFTPENKTQTAADFPKLKLEMNERARIVLLEDPEMAYVHTLRAPQIINGVVQTVMIERRDGEKVQDYKMDFVGRPLCLGDEGVLKDRGSDPKNCPVCAMAAEGDLVQPPQRRYAMHVIRYNTRPGSFEISNPFGVQTVIWAFTDQIFNKLVDFASEWGDLRRHDLLLGPCTNPTFQKAELAIANKAEWLANPERRQVTAETFKNNQAPNLVEFCGRKVERRWLEDDLQKIRDRWAVATGKGRATSDSLTGTQVGAGSLTEGLDELLGGSGETKPGSGGQESFDELLAGVTAPTSTPNSAPETSFEDLLTDPINEFAPKDAGTPATPPPVPSPKPGPEGPSPSQQPTPAQEPAPTTETTDKAKPAPRDATADILAGLDDDWAGGPGASSDETLDMDALLKGI